MNMLLVAATTAEIGLTTEWLQTGWEALPGDIYMHNGHAVKVLVAGVGVVATAYAVTKALGADKYDMVLQAGIGGSFDRDIPLGSVVLVASERYGDVGAEDHDEYLDVFDMGLAEGDTVPFAGRELRTPLDDRHIQMGLPQVSGLTVSTVSGSEKTVARRAAMYGCAVESMEGAALHYVCLLEGVPFAQVRSISNYVAPRDRAAWKMKEAVIALNGWLQKYLEHTTAAG